METSETFSLKILRLNFDHLYKFKTIKMIDNIFFFCSQFSETDLENLFQKKEEKIAFVVKKIIDLNTFGKSILRMSFSKNNINIFNLLISRINKPQFEIPFIIASYVKNNYYLLILIKKYFKLTKPELTHDLFKSCIDNNKIEILYNIVFTFEKENIINHMDFYDIFDYSLKFGSIEIIEFLSFLRKDSIKVNSILCRDFNTILYCMKYFEKIDINVFKNVLSKKEIKILEYFLIS